MMYKLHAVNLYHVVSVDRNFNHKLKIISHKWILLNFIIGVACTPHPQVNLSQCRCSLWCTHNIVQAYILYNNYTSLHKIYIFSEHAHCETCLTFIDLCSCAIWVHCPLPSISTVLFDMKVETVNVMFSVFQRSLGGSVWFFWLVAMVSMGIRFLFLSLRRAWWWWSWSFLIVMNAWVGSTTLVLWWYFIYFFLVRWWMTSTGFIHVLP